MYVPTTLQKETVHKKFHMGLKFLTDCRVDLMKIKIHIAG